MEQSSLQENKDRIERLRSAQKNGIDTFPSKLKWKRTKIGSVTHDFKKIEKGGKSIAVAGRITSIRKHGQLAFADLQDDSGKIQLYFKKDTTSDKGFDAFTSYVDRGDFCCIKGTCAKTKRGEESILVSDWQLLSKSLLPLPTEWFGLKDVESRFRKREIDLLINPSVKERALKRSQLVNAFRDYLISRDFTEVETPILQPIAGGAIAKPFITEHNALSQEMFLRIAPELYLKRLIVGGFEKVFEVARCFRNEGVDTAHNPEFTQIELYWAYADFNDLMDLTEHMLISIIKKVFNSHSLPHDNTALKFTAPFRRLTYAQAMKEYANLDMSDMQLSTLQAYADEQHLSIKPEWGVAKILDEIFKLKVRPQCIQPVYITQYPAMLSPLAKKNPKNALFVDQFQLLAGGMEIVKAFSECNDPLDQKERFEEQAKLRSKGDDEAHQYDKDFIEALEYGMPPTAGLGIGIDRLCMLLTNTSNIKEVILFPTLKQKN